MGSFVATAVATKDRYIAADFGEVGNADDIKAQTGHDVTGYRRWVDNYALRHALAKHGNPKAEASRGQVAITTDDLALVNRIVSEPDAVIDTGKTDRNLQVIVSEKVVGEFRYFVSEELRTKWKRLAMLTMWKRKK